MSDNIPLSFRSSLEELERLAEINLSEKNITLSIEDLGSFQASFYSTGSPVVSEWGGTPPLMLEDLPYAAYILIVCRDLRKKGNRLDYDSIFNAGLFIGTATKLFTMYYDENIPSRVKERVILEVKGKLVSEIKTESGRHAANARHKQKGASRDKKAQVLDAWATGCYETRNACAEAIYKELCISYETARKHLVNSPKPNKKSS